MQPYAHIGAICLNVLLLSGTADGCKSSSSCKALTFFISFAAWFLLLTTFSAFYSVVQRACCVQARLVGALSFTCLRILLSEVVQCFASSENCDSKLNRNIAAFFAGEIASSFVLSSVILSRTPIAASSGAIENGWNQTFLSAAAFASFSGRLLFFHMVLMASGSLHSRLFVRVSADILACIGSWVRLQLIFFTNIHP